MINRFLRKLDSLQYRLIENFFRFRLDDRIIRHAFKGNPKTVHPVLDSGLANRIRTLLSCTLSFEFHDYHWSYWNDHRVGDKEVTDLEYYFDSLKLKRIHFSWFYKKYRSMSIAFHIQNDKDVLLFDILNSGGLNGRDFINIENKKLNEVRQIFWDMLRPNASVIRMAKDLDDGIYACIHIRNWEFLDSPNSVINRSDYQKIKILSSYSFFIENIKALIREIPDDVPIYVCSAYFFDIKKITNNRRGSIKTFPRIYNEQFKQDYLEFLFMSMSRYIIATRYSTFSHLAGILSRDILMYKVFD